MHRAACDGSAHERSIRAGNTPHGSRANLFRDTVMVLRRGGLPFHCTLFPVLQPPSLFSGWGPWALGLCLLASWADNTEGDQKTHIAHAPLNMSCFSGNSLLSSPASELFRVKNTALLYFRKSCLSFIIPSLFPSKGCHCLGRKSERSYLLYLSQGFCSVSSTAYL